MRNTDRLIALSLCCGLLTIHAQTVTATVDVGIGPAAVAVNPITNKIYVANTASNTVTIRVTHPAGTSGQVVAIEPDSFLVSLLRRSVASRSADRAEAWRSKAR